MAKRIWSLFVASSFIGGLFSQNATNQPPLSPPLITAETPDWAKLMYSDAPNAYEVDRLYREYYETHPFEKTMDTRNYKHWRRFLSRHECVQPDGSIRIPTYEELEVRKDNWLHQKEELDETTPADRSPTSVWEHIGPYENTGTGTTYHSNQSCQVAFSQCLGDMNVLYSVSQNGKVFKTTNHGESWFPVGENYFFEGDTYQEQCITVHPTNPNIVYFGTTNRIWKTTDGGTTWTNIFTASGLQPGAIIIDPNTPETLLVAGELGIHKSTNGGSSFTLVRSGLCWDLRYKTNDPTTVFAICRNGLKSDFYKSTNGGDTWTPSLTGWFSLPQTSDGGGRMTVSTGNPNLIYCFILGRVTGDAATKPIVGVAKSTDAGATWTQPITWNNTKGLNSGQGYYDLDIEVSDTDDNLLFLGTQTDWKTIDGFATVTAHDLVHADVQEIHFNGPNDMWVATDGGMDLLNAAITTNSPKSIGISGTEFWGFDQGWNEDIRVGSYYHNGTSGYRPNYPDNKFRETGGSEPATGYISVGTPGKVWFNEVGGKYLPTTHMGELRSWTYNKFPNEHYWSEHIRSEIVYHPLYFNTHFLGKDNVLWKTTDCGTTFVAQYTFGSTAASVVTSIEISRSNPQIMYVYQLISNGSGGFNSGKLWKTTDGGTTFNEITQPASAPYSDGCFVAIDPVNPDLIWLAYNKTSSSFKVFKSTNGGGSWTNLTTSLLTGLLPCGLLHIGGTDGGVYLMTPHTVFYRNNSHTDWQAFGNGLPVKLENNYIRPFYKEGKIRLATIARGLWSVDMYEAPTSIIAQPTVDKQVADCPRDTFYFDDYSMLNHTGATWTWSFSPAPQYVSSLTARNPKIVFGATGSYNVTLTITSGSMTDTKVVNNMVTVNSFCDPDTIPGQLLRTAADGDYFVSTEANLTNLTHLTFTGWIKPNGAGDNFGAIFSSGDWCAHCDDIEGLIFDYDGNKLWYRWPGDTDEWWHNSGMTIPLNEWSYVALVVTPTAATLYLNDKKFVNTRAHGAGNIESIHFGKGFYDSYFKGDMDEFTMWRRELTEAEIRNLRHITKEDVIPTDPTLIGYWQFNDLVNNKVMDHAGQFHGNLLGAATLATSTAPVGGGVSQSFTLTTGVTTYDFAQAGAKIWMSDCEQSTGTIVASRLNVAPDAQPSANDFPENYWILNHYDGGGGFPPLDSIELTPTDAGFVTSLTSASAAVLHLRSENGEGDNWATMAKGINKTGNSLRFNRKSTVLGSTQVTLSNGAPYFDEVDPGRICEVDTIPGNVLEMPGNSGDYAAIPALNLNSNTVTMSAWVKSDGLQNSRAGIIFCRGGGTVAGLGVAENNALSYHWNGGEWGWVSGATLPQDEWCHLVLVVKPDSAIIYVNGVAYGRQRTHSAEEFDAITRIGNDASSSSRTFDGQIDEVCIWNRALSRTEVRELMHLTKEDVVNLAGQELKVYLQFNEASGKAYDKTGNNYHATLNSANVTRSTSTAPVGGGVSSRQTVNSGGVYTFGTTGVKMGFTSTTPNGEVLVSRLNVPPDQNPEAGSILTDSVYWIIRNFGSNSSFTTLDSIVFENLPTITALDEANPSAFSLYKRRSNDFGNTWGSGQDVADLVENTGNNFGKITFSNGNNIASFSQFVIGDTRGVLVSPKVFLQGPYSSGLMGDALRSNALLPTMEPYSGISNFTHKNGGGAETCQASVFNTTGNDAIVDWVFVELRDANAPANVLYTRSALVQRDGDVVDMNGVSPVNFEQAVAGDYYVAVRHRNHLGVMTAAATALTRSTIGIDFTSSATSTYGTNAQKDLGSGVMGLWAGDATANGIVKYTGSANDRALILSRIGGTDVTNLVNGYYSEDVSMDGTIKYTGSQNDRAIILANIGGQDVTLTRLQQLP